MANPTATNVSVGKPRAAGGIFAAPPGSSLPTDATSDLDSAFVGLGYVSDAGLVNGVEVNTEDVVAWGGDTVLTIRTSRSETFSWTFIETNAAVMAEVYGPSNVTGTDETGLTVVHNNLELPSRVYVFEILMTGDRVKRIVVPNAKVTSVGDVSYVDGEPIGYEVTLGAFPDASGNTAYEYIAAVEPESSPASS